MNYNTQQRRRGHLVTNASGLHKGYQPKVQPKRLKHRSRKNKVDKTLYESRLKNIHPMLRGL